MQSKSELTDYENIGCTFIKAKEMPFADNFYVGYYQVIDFKKATLNKRKNSNMKNINHSN